MAAVNTVQFAVPGRDASLIAAAFIRPLETQAMLAIEIVVNLAFVEFDPSLCRRKRLIAVFKPSGATPAKLPKKLACGMTPRVLEMYPV